MKDSTKKRLIIAGLVAVSVLLIFGISRVLYKEPVQELPKESKPTEEVELMVDTEETGQVQKETESTEETKELIIETETENGVESGKQEIQQTPEKTEDEKPEEPPALTEDALQSRIHHQSMRSRKGRNRLWMILRKPEIPKMV